MDKSAIQTKEYFDIDCEDEIISAVLSGAGKNMTKKAKKIALIIVSLIIVSCTSGRTVYDEMTGRTYHYAVVPAIPLSYNFWLDKYSSPPDLRVYCWDDGSGTVSFSTDEIIDGDVYNKATVQIKIDSKRTIKLNGDVSNDYETVTIHNANELIGKLLSGNKLTVRIPAYTKGYIQASFSLKGLEKAMEPYGASCRTY